MTHFISEIGNNFSSVYSYRLWPCVKEKTLLEQLYHLLLHVLLSWFLRHRHYKEEAQLWLFSLSSCSNWVKKRWAGGILFDRLIVTSSAKHTFLYLPCGLWSIFFWVKVSFKEICVVASSVNLSIDLQIIAGCHCLICLEDHHFT